MMKRCVFLAALLLLLGAGACAAQEAQIVLPASLRMIEEETFSGSGIAGDVIVAEGTREILSLAFAGCPISRIVLPASLDYIAPDAFDGCGDVTFTAPEGSYARSRCLELGLREAPANPETAATRYVSVPKLRLYAQPTSASSPRDIRYMDRLELGSRVSGSESARWHQVLFGEETMYVYLESGRPVLTKTKSSHDYPAENAVQREIIDLALEVSEEWTTVYASGQSTGIPDENGVYRFGCAGLVRYLLTTVMEAHVPLYTIPGDVEKLNTLAILSNEGLPGETPVDEIPFDELQAGDVLFFASRSDGGASTVVAHCGLYLGNNEFVHATSEWEDAVCIMPLTDTFRANLRGARRYLHETLPPANTQAVVTGPYMGYKLYSRKDVDSELIATVSDGSPATILYTDSTIWAYIRLEDGTEGYLLKKYLE